MSGFSYTDKTLLQPPVRARSVGTNRFHFSVFFVENIGAKAAIFRGEAKLPPDQINAM